MRIIEKIVLLTAAVPGETVAANDRIRTGYGLGKTG